MGVRYSAADSALLIQALTNNITTANQVSDRLASGCDHLMSALDSGELQGAAYTAGRGLFSDIIIPSIKKLQEAIDDIQAELTSYIAADSVVSEFGSLDLDQLKQIKELRHKQWENVNNQIAENKRFFTQAEALLSGKLANLWQETFALQEILNNIEDHIRELDDKIEKLQWFVGQVSRYFTDSLTVLNLAIKGATQLSQVIVDSNGGYSVQGLDMSWVEQMKNEEIQTHTLDSKTPITKTDIEKANIVEDYMNSYNLDKETSTILYNLQQGILKRAEKEDWSKERTIYEFNRLIAAFVPDNFGAEKPWSRWRAVSGSISEVERNEISQMYGLSLSDINRLKEKLTEQHNDSSTYKDLAHEAIQIAAFTEQSWGFNLSSGIHIISEVVNTQKVNIGTTTASFYIPMEHYEISFKGDIDSGRYGDTDFNSDLDAISSYTRMMKESVDSKDVFLVQARYNNEINSNEINRVEEFYTNMGNGNAQKGKENVEYIVEAETFGGSYIKHNGDIFDIAFDNKASHEDKAKGDFYDYLKRGRDSNVR